MKVLRIKVLSFILIIMITLSASINSYVTAFSASFTLIDYSTDISYSVTADNGVNLTSWEYSTYIPIDSPVLSCCIHNGKLYVLSYTDTGNGLYASFYTYNTNNNELTNTLTNLSIAPDASIFTVDSSNRFYLVDRFNNYQLNCYQNGLLNTFDLNSTIRQIMCLDGINVIVITTKGVYLIQNQVLMCISETPPVTPCTYMGKGIVSSASGQKYTYENGNLILFTEETSAPDSTDTNTAPVENSNIIRIENNYIFLHKDTTVAKLYKNLNLSKDKLTVYKADSSVLVQGKLGTGMTAAYNGNLCTIIIYGDLTGEGNINSRDTKLMMKFLTGELAPDSVQRTAADINCDGVINTKDLVYLSKLY